MKIKKLTLHNFGVYAGDNTFEFGNTKPIVLIGGMNGRGKTTFLEAVLLSLYGSNSFAYSESKQRSYSQYLSSFINKNADDQTCSVELEFEIVNGNSECYLIKRMWNSLNKKPIEKISVNKDGVYNEFLTENWPMFIENILPSALSSFFFFDGEKIAEMAVDSTNIQLKNAIRSMLGITVLDVLRNDILRNLKKVGKSIENSVSSDRVQKLREEKESAINSLEKIDSQIEKLAHTIVVDNDKLDALHKQYTAMGGDVLEKKQEIIQKRSDLKSDLSVKENRLYELSSVELPLLLVKDLINDIKTKALEDRDKVIMKQAIDQLQNLLSKFKKSYNGDSKSSSDFMKYVKSENDDEVSVTYELSDKSIYLINQLVDKELENAKIETKSLLQAKRKIEKEINELDSYLSLDINDKELQHMYSKIISTEKAIIEKKSKMVELEQKRNDASSLANSVTSEFNKCVETYLSTVELRDNDDRLIKYSNMALSLIEKYQVELQKRKTGLLAKTITECYKKLANKKNLIARVEMDSDSLNMKYISEDGSEIQKNSLSAGEQQLMVIATLWALAISSKKKLPCIIDTPLSRLDSLHRTTLIETYFPNAGEQTIILSTDTEIDAKYYKLMKKNVGDEFTLNYNEKTKSTSILKGYLIGAEQ